MLFMKLKLIPLACINSLPSNGANSNRCIMPYDLPISTNYAESKFPYKFHMFLLCCMYYIGSNRDIPKVDLIAIQWTRLIGRTMHYTNIPQCAVL